MNHPHFKRIRVVLLAVLAMSGWIGYLGFIYGRFPGIYPLATLHSLLLSPLVSLAVGLSLVWWILLPIILLCLSLFTLYVRRRRLRLAFTALLFWPLLIAVFLPAMVGFSPGQRLAIEPWQQVYRTVYSSLWIDDNYGDLLLFKCDRTGLFCQRVHKHYSFVGAVDEILMQYDAERDLFRLGDEPVMYVRSRTKQLCSAPEADSYSPDRRGCSLNGEKAKVPSL